MRILILDDGHSMFSVLLEESLKRQGFGLIRCARLDEALRQLRDADVFVTMDELPEVTGLEAAHLVLASGWRGPMVILPHSSDALRTIAKFLQ